jgi:AcrR family transcriptional regulator
MPQTPRSNGRRRKRDTENDARRAERRAELLRAANQVVKRDGPNASMSAIAAEGGVTKPILYKHFGDKGGLYQAIAEFYVRQLMERLRDALKSENDPHGLIRRTIDAYIGFVEEEPEAYRFLMHRAISERPEAEATVSQFIQQVAREVAVILGEELRRAGIDSGGAQPWAHGIVGMVQLAGDWWLKNRTMTRERLVEYLDVLLWSGFSTLPAPRREEAASG